MKLPALIAYIVAGYPTVDESVELALALVRGGADVIELGIPFSDPIADGPTIQRATSTALKAGVSVPACLDIAARIRSSCEVPLVAMGYANPIVRYGIEGFCRDGAATGLNGIIIADLPPEESGGYLAATREQGIDPIFLVAPTSTDERLERAAQASRGFLYCVSLTGVTGARDGLADSARRLIQRARQHTTLPLALGFGIARPEHVQEVSGLVDAVIVGSAIIDLIDSTPPARRAAALEAFAASMTT